MTTSNSSKVNEQDFKTESLTAAKNSDKSGRLNAATQNEVAVQSLINPGAAVTNPRYPNSDSLLDDVKNRYLI